MRIGHIVQNARCGHSYLSKNFVDALSTKHDVFLLTTNGVKEDYPFWDGYTVQHVDVEYLNVGSREAQVLSWIQEQKLDVVFVQEFYDWRLVQQMKQLVKVVNYVDWFSEQTLDNFVIYDANIVCAEHVFEVFERLGNVHYVDWGVDEKLYEPKPGAEYNFFHSAGWGGINDRKCTPQVLRAFDKLKEGTMLMASQSNVFEHEALRIAHKHWGERLGVHYGTVEPPGLYKHGEVYVGVSRLEGLGLYIPEALASGLPVITTDAAPMNQFVKDGETGLLVKTTGSHKRQDGYYFPEHDIDVKDLVAKMKWCVEHPSEVAEMGKKARSFIEANHSLEQFTQQVLDVFESV